MTRVTDEQLVQWRAVELPETWCEDCTDAHVDPTLSELFANILDALESERAQADGNAALAVAAYDGNTLISQANARFDELAAQMRALAEEFESGEYSAIDVGERILDTLDGKDWSPR